MRWLLVFLLGMMAGGTLGIFTLCLFQIHRPTRAEYPENVSERQRKSRPERL